MERGILLVETYPATPERVDEYNDWYDNVHMGEVVALPGFVSARRFEPVDGEGPFVAVYEIEADDLNSTVAALGAAMAAGKLQMTDALQMDPVPSMRVLRTTTA